MRKNNTKLKTCETLYILLSEMSIQSSSKHYLILDRENLVGKHSTERFLLHQVWTQLRREFGPFLFTESCLAVSWRLKASAPSTGYLLG